MSSKGTRSVYVCQQCGVQSPKWIGHCTSCNGWNTYVEEIIEKVSPATKAVRDQFSRKRNTAAPVKLSQIGDKKENRIMLSDGELNRVLGGGLVSGSLVLFGGEPGIGKSTLMLQIALAAEGIKVLYVSGEESEQQIKMRADRLGISNEECYVLTETSTNQIISKIEEFNPGMIIIDSIQTLYSPYIESTPGSVSQIRQCASEMMKLAKETDIPVFLIGHVTKDGSLAGPKILEHMVDTVLQFEGERNNTYRLLRTLKNRFGSTNELGIYEMLGNGLRQVSNPSEVLITTRDESVSGVAIAAMVEGLRPMLIETQALVSTAAYGTPQRSATGFDTRRLNMLLAVLEKRCGFKLGIKDVFINIAGGLHVEDPGIDLALVAAILSSNAEITIPGDLCFAAEVGLSGELRAVNRIDQRIAEAERLGFREILVSRYAKTEGVYTSINIIRLSKIEEAFAHLFG